jgi:hypothetical protein
MPEFVLEGEQKQARKSVLRVLALRFGLGEDEAKELKGALEHITDLDRLRELHALSIQARRLSQFRKALAPM